MLHISMTLIIGVQASFYNSTEIQFKKNSDGLSLSFALNQPGYHLVKRVVSSLVEVGNIWSVT